MYRYVSLLLIVLGAGSVNATDAFDYYRKPLLAQIAEGKYGEGVQEVKELTAAQLTQFKGVASDSPATLVVVKTNDGRYAKLLVQAAARKISETERIPMLLIERYLTYKETGERAIQASGQNVNLFDGFRLHLDIGQVVPEKLRGDLHVRANGDSVIVSPLGSARMFIVTKALPEAAPPKNRPKVGGPFQPKFFNGTYKLYDDGRRSGLLVLKLSEDGEVTGSFTSDRDNREYEVTGKTGPAQHQITFVVKLPATQLTYSGHLFRGDARALAGTAKLLDQESAFYAVRSDD